MPLRRWGVRAMIRSGWMARWARRACGLVAALSIWATVNPAAATRNGPPHHPAAAEGGPPTLRLELDSAVDEHPSYVCVLHQAESRAGGKRFADLERPNALKDIKGSLGEALAALGGAGAQEPGACAA